MKGYDASTVGRRKEAVARAFLKKGSGQITVNNKSYTDYFERDTLRLILTRPLRLLKVDEEFDVKFTVVGGGKSGQAGACRHALSRALNDFNPEFRAALKVAGLLTRDPRAVERKRYGRHKARKSTQFSKR